MASIASFRRRLKEQAAISISDGEWLSTGLADDVCRTVGHRGRKCFWTPALTALTFLRQILHGNCACRHAVAMSLDQSIAFGAAGNRARGADAASGETPADRMETQAERMSGDPSAFVQARARLPLSWFAELHRRMADAVRQRVAEAIGQRVAEARRWCGRRVYIIDGSTFSMPDTPELQRTFGQPYGQKPGCGFPQARLTAVFCHASGALLDLAADSHRVSEQTLLRRMLSRFQPGDVILADRGFHGYAGLVDFVRRGLDVVMRLNEGAWPDLRPLRRLSKDDQIAVWHRPRVRPRRLSRRQWDQIPETMTVRLVRYRVSTPGFRSRRIELLTTLLDDRAFSADDLAGLYRDRWLAELNLRGLKTTLGMDVLKGKTPDIIYKEVFMYAVAYNLIRGLMWQAADDHDCDPGRLSLAGTQQRILAMLPYLDLNRSTDDHRLNQSTRDHRLNQPTHGNRRLVQRLLKTIAADPLPFRPNRIEPRAVKRRRKSYVPLIIPRARYRRILKLHAA